jgi:hypothetical protein
MPTVTFQQVKDIKRGFMPASAGRKDRSDWPHEVADPG